ncbi:hypothetical protein HK104_009505 [Borealophlyctis nickersoniae]|nr:hypothetical protein HK104_009505 [Borealophlyctis nickersoniae]
MSQPTRKELEETLRSATRSLLDQGTPVTDILNVIRSEALRASKGLPPRHIVHNPNVAFTGRLNSLAKHLLWKKKKAKGYPNVRKEKPYYLAGVDGEESDGETVLHRCDKGDEIEFDDLERRDDEDLVEVMLMRGIGEHFTYEKSGEGDAVISDIFKEYYITEVLLTDDETLALLVDSAPPLDCPRKRIRYDRDLQFGDSEEDKDFPRVMLDIIAELRNAKEKDRDNFYSVDELDSLALYEKMRPSVCGISMEAFPRIDELVPYLKEGGKWPDRVEDLEHPSCVERAKVEIGLKGAGCVKMTEVPALADFEVWEGEYFVEGVKIDLDLEDFTLDGGGVKRTSRIKNIVIGK